MLESFTFSFRERLLIFFFQKQYSVHVQWLPQWCWYIWMCYTFKYLTSECPSGIATDCWLSVNDIVNRFCFQWLFQLCCFWPLPFCSNWSHGAVEFKIRRRKGNKKILWTFKIDPREEGKDRKTLWTFKMDPIPSESSVFNGAIFGPAIFLVILCTSINKDWKYKDKDKGLIVGPAIFLHHNYKDWKYKSCPLVLFSTSTLSEIFAKPFKIIQIKKNRTVFLDSQIISSAKILWQSRRR